MKELYHKGEIAVQQKVGVEAMASSVGRIISDKIHKRVNGFIEEQPNAVIENGTTINQQIKDWIIKSDTFFIGSKSDNNKLDASHRGGNKGFIEIIENTLGNIHQNSKAGLLFIDFEKGNTLQITGKSSVLFDQNSEEDLIKTGGAGRYLLFNIEKWVKTENHHNIEWDFLSNSPFNPSF